IGEGDVATYPLPRVGEISIGRAETNDVCIDHALISREHAKIRVGDIIEVVDLGSRNGTRIRGEQLASGGAKQILVGQVMEFGSTMALIQRRSGAPKLKPLSTHAHFELRLEELCQRAKEMSFALVRVHVDADVPAAEVCEALQAVL